MKNLSILLIGDADRREFRQALAGLATLAQVTRTADVKAAVALLIEPRVVCGTAATAGLSSSAAFDIIVLAQAYPGEFSPAAVERLRQLAPLARMVALLGSWCEGEMRSGKPWPAAVRTYWHQWPARADLELRRLAAGRDSTWALPATATEEERLLADAGQPLPQRHGLIVIYARSFVVADWLSAACLRYGHATVWWHPRRRPQVRGAAAVVFDGWDCGEEVCRTLRQVAAAMAPAPLVALLDFPRIEDIERARDAGAAAVLSKPLHLQDLFWQLDRL